MRQKVAVHFNALTIPSEHLESKDPLHEFTLACQGRKDIAPARKGFWNMAWPHLLPPGPPTSFGCGRGCKSIVYCTPRRLTDWKVWNG